MLLPSDELVFAPLGGKPAELDLRMGLDRGLAVGLAVGGYGAGSAIFGPLAQLKLIPAYGLPATFKILAAIFFVMTMVGAVLLRNPPAGYRPDGWSPSAATRCSPSTRT